MQTVTYSNGSFALHGMKPASLKPGGRVSAWFRADGTMTDAEVITRTGASRNVKPGGPIWKYCEGVGKRIAPLVPRFAPKAA